MEYNFELRLAFLACPSRKKTFRSLLNKLCNGSWVYLMGLKAESVIFVYPLLFSEIYLFYGMLVIFYQMEMSFGLYT